MVRAEGDRDYYGDLELPPTASANDIKKQFKKLALQYHPDRNPDGDTTAKFQSIQAANEVLTDPQQRAKYDAQRIRSGLLHTYTDAPPPPPRRNAAQRSPTSNFPPPPKPPAFKPKTNSSPPRTGPSKYTQFNAADPPTSSYRRKDAEEARSKTNDFKAWEHMRHGQGPVPRARKEAPQPAKASTAQHGRYFSTGRDESGAFPKRANLRHTDWEDLPDAGMPNVSRANTTRVPPKTGYAPGTPDAGDERQARSSYFNIGRGDRPTSSSRTQTTMPPPPPRAPTARRPDPLQGFKAQMSNGDTFLGGKRGTTPYPTVHGEKTDPKSPGLQRSSTNATPRDSNSRTGFYDSDPMHFKNHHARATSTGSAREPKDFKKTGWESLSTTSSDSSSSDNDLSQRKDAVRPSKSAFLRPKQIPKSRKSRPRPGVPQRSFFNPHVRAEDAEDEPMAPHTDVHNGPRRHSGIDIPTFYANNVHPEGFSEHRRKHEAELANQPSTSAPTEARPRDGSATPISRPRSFDDHYRRPSQDPSMQSTSNHQASEASIFRWGQGDLPGTFTGKPPLRSQSSDRIDMKFSPSGRPPRFMAGGESSASLSSSTSNNPFDIPEPSTPADPKSAPPHGPEGKQTGEKLPPPPQGPACFFPNDWHHRFTAGTFKQSPPRERSRSTSQKRTGVSRGPSLANGKRNGASKAAGHQPKVDENENGPSSFVNVENGTGDRVSSEGSAMDIDPVSTPPSATDPRHPTNGDQISPTAKPTPTQKSWNQGPDLPPRTAIPIPQEPESSSLNMSDFKDARPFAASSEGLSDVGDLKSALPFESRAASSRPIFETAPSNLPAAKLPKPPKAPTAPLQLNVTTWDLYIRDMDRYMSNWRQFNNVMLSYFHSRQETAFAQLGTAWMSASGDDGYDKYDDGVREDQKVIKYWEVAYDLHRDAVKRLGEARNAMKAEIAKAS